MSGAIPVSFAFRPPVDCEGAVVGEQATAVEDFGRPTHCSGPLLRPLALESRSNMPATER
ncbi:hypothetical protein AB0B12_40240 [Streptomyces sp. NPDC044780]|uniref:hypothetical protein n=1 Tax=unclassified Streptomyces TaxID=2593676 RepID=UPI00340D3FA8